LFHLVGGLLSISKLFFQVVKKNFKRLHWKYTYSFYQIFSVKTSTILIHTKSSLHFLVFIINSFSWSILSDIFMPYRTVFCSQSWCLKDRQIANFDKKRKHKKLTTCHTNSIRYLYFLFQFHQYQYFFGNSLKEARLHMNVGASRKFFSQLSDFQIWNKLISLKRFLFL